MLNVAMRVIVLLFFILTAPLVIFLTTILYTSDLNTVLKTELARNNVYGQISSQLTNLNSEDAESRVVNSFLQSALTPQYIQTKTETTIDSSFDWIRGKSATPPVLSFKDIKDKIFIENPQLLSTIEGLAKEMKNQPIQQDSSQEGAPQDQPDAQAMKSIDALTSLSKSDFTIKLDQYLAGVKNFYNILRILQPILVGLLFLYLVLLFVLSKTWSSRLKWVGATLILSGALGFGVILFDLYFLSALSSIPIDSNPTAKIVSPIVIQIIKHFVDVYINYQTTANIVLLIIGAGAFAAGLFIKTAPSPKAKVNKKK